MPIERRSGKVIGHLAKNTTLTVLDFVKCFLAVGTLNVGIFFPCEFHIGLSIICLHPSNEISSSPFFNFSNDQDDIRAEWERVKFSYEILIDKKLRMKYDRHSALNDPAAAVGRMAVDTLGWGMTSLAKGIFQIGDLAAKSVREKKDNNGVTADDNNSVSGTHSHSDNGTYRNAPGASRFEMQGNAAVFTLPAPTLQQEIMSRIHVFFKSEAIVETKDVTCIVVGWAMKIIGRSIFDLGRSATNHASKM